MEQYGSTNEQRLARLEAAYDAIARVETKIDEISEIIIQVTKLEHAQQNSQRSILLVTESFDKLNKKLDEINLRIDSSISSLETKMSIAVDSKVAPVSNELGKLSEKFYEFKDTTRAFNDRLKGMGTIIVSVLSIAQAVIGGTALWVGSEILETKDRLLTIEVNREHEKIEFKNVVEQVNQLRK